MSVPNNERGSSGVRVSNTGRGAALSLRGTRGAAISRLLQVDSGEQARVR